MAIVVMTACFPQNRAAFLVSLALWGAGCALVATLLRNFAAYAAALAGYTAAIIASDQLGATGGLNGQAFMLAVTRASEICIGIVCAGIVLAGTDFGGARRRLATLFAAISAEISGRFTDTLATAGAEFEDTQTVRRELIRRVIALDPVIDEAFGEFFPAPLPFAGTADGHRRSALSPGRLAGGGGSARSDCRMSGRGKRRPPFCRQCRRNCAQLPSKASRHAGSTNPTACSGCVMRRCGGWSPCRRRTPSLRLLADQTAEVLGGISHALNGLALLVDDPARPVSRRRGTSASASPIGFPLWSMPGALSS